MSDPIMDPERRQAWSSSARPTGTIGVKGDEVAPVQGSTEDRENAGAVMRNLYAREGRMIPVSGDPSKLTKEDLLDAYNQTIEPIYHTVPAHVTIYLSGPMTGIPEYNYPAFKKYAEKYRALGFRVISPPELDNGDTGRPYEYYLRRDIGVLLSEGIERMYLMPGWHKSKGATLEQHIASRIGIELWDAETGLPYTESVPQEAHRLVHGDRQEAYGHPIFDMTRTADLWTAQFRDKLRPGVQFEAEDVGQGMILVKMSRERNKQKRDNRVDAAGYAETLELMEKWRAAHPGVDPREQF